MSSNQQDSLLSDITNNLISEFDTQYLPSNLNVIRRLLYETQTKKTKVSDAIKTVIEEVMFIWEKSSIDMKRIYRCKDKLKILYGSFADVRKFQNRVTKKVTDFYETMTDVFDISKDSNIKLL